MATRDFLTEEFEIDPDLMNYELNDSDDELEEGEQNLEGEANAMLAAWNRDEFLKEVQDEKIKIKRDQEYKEMDFYDGDTEFEKIAEEMTPLDGDQVFIKIIESNPSGKEIFADNTVLFDSVAYLEFEVGPFASSIYDGKPSKVNLAVGPIIAGLLQALMTMREGERANILIKPSMAFGSMGCFPTIPPDSSILYQVKVYKVWENSKLEALIEAERTEHFEAPHLEVIRIVEEDKIKANQLMKDDQIRDAVLVYKLCIKRLQDIPHTFLERCKNAKELMLSLLQNCALGLNSLKFHKSASKYAKRALDIDNKSLKAYYQLVKARIGAGKLGEAHNLLVKVNKLAPNNPCFNKLKIQLDQSYTNNQDYDEIVRKMSQGIF